MSNAKNVKPRLQLEVISGVEGPSIYLCDYRIAGPKPWGGGRTINSFTTTIDDLCRAIPGLTYSPASEEGG